EGSMGCTAHLRRARVRVPLPRTAWTGVVAERIQAGAHLVLRRFASVRDLRRNVTTTRWVKPSCGNDPANCAAEFTVAELRQVYEIVWGRPLDSANFHRKITRAEGVLVPTGTRTTRHGGRPAVLYRAGPATVLH